MDKVQDSARSARMLNDEGRGFFYCQTNIVDYQSIMCVSHLKCDSKEKVGESIGIVTRSGNRGEKIVLPLPIHVQ